MTFFCICRAIGKVSKHYKYVKTMISSDEEPLSGEIHLDRLFEKAACIDWYKSYTMIVLYIYICYIVSTTIAHYLYNSY